MSRKAASVHEAGREPEGGMPDAGLPEAGSGFRCNSFDRTRVLSKVEKNKHAMYK